MLEVDLEKQIEFDESDPCEFSGECGVNAGFRNAFEKCKPKKCR